MTDQAKSGGQSGVSRRALLKGAAATAGVAVGSGAITGFPTIWAQNIKDITLVHIGGSYAAIKEIADQAKKDAIAAGQQQAPQSAEEISALQHQVTDLKGLLRVAL